MAHRLFARIAVFLAVLALPACGMLSDELIDLRPKGSKPRAGSLRTPVMVRVVPVQGTSIPMGRLLAQAVSDELNALNVTATAGTEAEPRYLLAGEADTGAGRGANTAVIRWALQDRGGEAVTRFDQGVRAPRWRWDYGDPPLLRQIGADAAAQIAQSLGRSQAAPTGPPEKPGLWVGPVTGAPGDGNTALARAMGDALRGAGVRTVPEVGAGAYRLTGRVAVGPAVAGAQRVSVEWTVHDGAGAKIGSAKQANDVPAGSLDGPWGILAGDVALAAADGIKRMIERAGAPRAP